MINSMQPFVYRRESLGLSISEVQSRLSNYGFHYPVEALASMERGEKRFPVENPGFVLAMSQCLDMPVMEVQHAARQSAQALRAERTFWNKVGRLRPQNQVLLRFVFKHPNLTLIPGFDFMFELVKSICLQLPDDWFTSGR
jgi:hypothetical protein